MGLNSILSSFRIESPNQSVDQNFQLFSDPKFESQSRDAQRRRSRRRKWLPRGRRVACVGDKVVGYICSTTWKEGGGGGGGGGGGEDRPPKRQTETTESGVQTPWEWPPKKPPKVKDPNKPPEYDRLDEGVDESGRSRRRGGRSRSRRG